MERGSEIIHMPPIKNPSQEQLSYFLTRAAFLDEVVEIGGMTAQEAAYERSLVLGRIGMGKPIWLLTEAPDGS
jgi:hypothetical protein